MTNSTTPNRARTGAWVFDWNGTVVDDLPRALTASNEVLAAMDLPAFDLPGFKRAFSLPLRDFMLGAGVPSPDAAAAVDRWNQAVARRPSSLRGGMQEVLTKVIERGELVIVLSAASREVVWGDAHRLGVAALLHQVIGDAQDKSRVLARLADDYALQAFVGDTAHDVRAGRAAGIRAIGLAGGYHERSVLVAESPDALYDTISALLGDVAEAPRRPERMAAGETSGSR